MLLIAFNDNDATLCEAGLVLCYNTVVSVQLPVPPLFDVAMGALAAAADATLADPMETPEMLHGGDVVVVVIIVVVTPVEAVVADAGAVTVVTVAVTVTGVTGKV